VADAPPGEVADAAADAPPGAPDATPAPDAFACPSGYTLRAPGSCHRYVMIPVPWGVAEADCEGAGAHLVVIDDVTEDGEVPNNVWIGFTENITPGMFRWVTGAAVTFTGWATGEPVAGGSTCTEARGDGWHDDGCVEAKFYVCEYDGVPADPTQF
jgi:hypothetical protein